MSPGGLLAVLLLLVPAAAHSQGGGGSLTVWIKLPETPDPASVQKARETRAALTPLLGVDLRQAILVPKEGESSKSHSMRFSGPEQALALEERHRIVERLYALWGRENVAVESGQLLQDKAPWARAFPAAPPSFFPRSREEAARALEALLPQSLRSGAFGPFYDQGVLRDSLAAAPVVNRAQAAAPAASQAPLRAVIPEAVRAVIVPEPDNVENLIRSAANEFKVDAAVIRAVVQAKSGGDVDRVSGGAIGLMGVTMATGRALASELGYPRKGLDLKDPAVNIRAGAAVLSRLCRTFDCSTPEGRSRALAAYQVGPKAVIDSGGLPNDRLVKEFLEQFELAYRRGVTRPDGTVVKPPVTPVVPPKAPNVRKKVETWRELVAPAIPVDGIPGHLAQWLPIVDRFVAHFDLKSRLGARGIDARKFIAAKIQAESSGNHRAVGGLGEQGLLQLMPETAARLGVKDGFDPLQNLKGGIGFFSDLFRRLGDPILALAGYNGGPKAVEDLKGKIPRATESHVKKVARYYENMGGGRIDLNPYLQPRRPAAKTRRRASPAASAD